MGFAASEDPTYADRNLNIPANKLSDVDKAGPVARQSTFLKVWKDRHIVVTKDSLMYWYTSPTSTPEEVLSLRRATGVRREEVAGRSHTFVVSMKGVAHLFSAPSAEEMEAWIRVIGKAIVRSSTVDWDETSDRLEQQQQQ